MATTLHACSTFLALNTEGAQCKGKKAGSALPDPVFLQICETLSQMWQSFFSAGIY